MPLYSAGILLYRQTGGQLQVLLAHPGGPFWAKKDDGVWSIPKGLLGEGEDPLAAARREFHEEIGVQLDAADAAFIALGEARQKGGKLVLAWALEGDLDADHITSNTYAIQWPKGVWRRYPEVDRAAWFTLEEARRKILSGQVVLLDRLLERLNAGDTTEPNPLP